MKIKFISLFLVIIFFSSLSKAEPSKTKSIITSNTVESLLAGLESGNIGLKTSSAFMLGELDVKSAVVPLMRMLRSGECDEAKIVAALSLYKLGTPMSVYALFQAARFEKSERVRKMCSRFYLEYIAQQKLIEF